MSDPILSIPFTSIDLTQNREVGDTSGLQASLKRLGTIHPPVLSKYLSVSGEVRYKPVAGRRRLLSLSKNGVKELFHNSILDPKRPGFQFKEDVDAADLAEATLDENLYRLKPKWQEDVLLVAEIHKLKKAKATHTKWGQAQTAELLGPGYSKSSVNLALKLAKLILAGDEEVMACANMMEATALRVKRAADGALSEMNKRRVEQFAQETPASPASPISASTASFLDTFNLTATGKGPLAAAKDLGIPAVGIVPQSAPMETKEKVKVPLSYMFWNEDMLKRDWPKVNHVITDIPYGIDMGNLNAKQVKDVKAEHEVEANVSLMKPFLKRAYDAVKQGGFCVFFYDLDHHEKLQGWAKDIGWKVQRWPLVWAKTHSCQNNAAQYNTTKNFEVAMVLRKDEHTVLRSQQPTSIFTCDGSAERKMYNNPFAKPFDLWKWIFDMVAFSGQTVLDPFCGEMSSCRAALNCGLIPYGIEINEKHFNRGLEHMQKAYAVIHKSNVIFT